MAVATGFAHKSQATFFGRTCLVVRSWSQALRGGATRCAQTYLRLYPCVARLLSVPPQAAQYLKLPLFVIAQTVVRVFTNSQQRCLTCVWHDTKVPRCAVLTSKSNSKKTTGTVKITIKSHCSFGNSASIVWVLVIHAVAGITERVAQHPKEQWKRFNDK